MNSLSLKLAGIYISLLSASFLNARESVPKFSIYEIPEKHKSIPSPAKSVPLNSVEIGEEILRFTEGNFSYIIYDNFCGEAFAAEIQPGWDIYSCDPLTIFPDGRVEIPSFVEHEGSTYKVIGISEFRNLQDITEFIIPESVKVLRHEAFEHSGIESIVIPDAVTDIEYGVFRDCHNLKSVYCGKNLANVQGNAFQGCENLGTFEISNENNHLEVIENFLVNKDNKEALIYFDRGKTDLVIPEGIESLSEDLCRWDEDLVTVTLSEGLKRINNYAFMECPNIREVRLPSTLEAIEWGAFSGTAIEQLIVPDNVSWLADCISNCPELKTVHIGKNVSLISNNGPFTSGCGHCIGIGSNNITKISVDPDNLWFTADENGLYTKSKNTIGKIIPTLNVVDLSDSNVTAIGSNAASYNNNHEIILPQHLKIIDGRPFEGTDLTEPIKIPYTMTYCNWDITFGYKPRDIYYYSNIPHPYLEDNQHMENEGITMHVPAGKKEVFENNHSYSHFTIVDDLPEQKLNCLEFGYHGDRFSADGYGVNGPATEGAILITSEQLKAYPGMQITGVNFNNSFSQSAYAFIDRLSTGERIAFQQLTPIEQGSMCHIRFDSPYVIQQGDNDLLIGIGFDDISNFPYSRMTNPVGNYWREKGQTEWIHGDPSSMTCTPTDKAWMWSVCIEGESIPVDGRLMNVEVVEDPDSKVYRVSGYFNNMSGMASSEIELAYSFISKETLLQNPRIGVLKENGSPDGKIIVEVNAEPMRSVPFSAEIPMPETGSFVLTVDVASINGFCDDLPENSMAYLFVNGQKPSSLNNIEDKSIKITRIDDNNLRIEGTDDTSIIDIISLDGTVSSHKANGTVTNIHMKKSSPVIIRIGKFTEIIP